MSGIKSGSAPNVSNVKSMVPNPATKNIRAMATPRNKLFVVSMAALDILPAPIDLETMAVAPIPIPWTMLKMTVTTGNVKLIAANSL